ncbi:hypothetical protein KAH55_02830 [bacterium]|nr:hypothetical protein [bacterium]
METTRGGFDDILYSVKSKQWPDHENTMSRRYLQLLMRWVPTGMRYFNEWPVRPNSGHFFGGVFWYGQETSEPMRLLALAASSNEYDAEITGFSRDHLRQTALKALRYVCFTHDTGPADCVRPDISLGQSKPCSTKWGERGSGFFRESQCGSTLNKLVLTAVLLQDILDVETWQMIVEICLDYLRRFGRMDPKSGVYWDTQTEENGWTFSGLVACALFLSGHPAFEQWMGTAKKWMFSTTALPRDSRNQKIFADGRTVAEWNEHRFTTLPDGLAENHGMVHPNYLGASVIFASRAFALYSFFGMTPPPHLFWHRKMVYETLKLTSDENGIPMPLQGMDWRYLAFTESICRNAGAHLMFEDADAAQLEISGLEQLKKIFLSYGDRFLDVEVARHCHGVQDPAIVWEHRGAQIIDAYLFHRLLGEGQVPTPKSKLRKKLSGFYHFPHGGLVLHKHEKGQVSFSWRNQTMVLPWNLDGTLLIGGAQGSYLARLTVEGHPQSETPVTLKVDARPDSGCVLLVQDIAQDSVRQEVVFGALPDGRTLVWEKLIARKKVTVSSLQQGFLHVINEPFATEGPADKAQRTLFFPDGSQTFPGFASSNKNDDIHFELESPEWVNLDNRMSFYFAGTGQTVYHNRHVFEVWRGLTDDFILSETPCQEYAEGQVVGQLVSLICPQETAAEIRPDPLLWTENGELKCALLEDYLCWANSGTTEFEGQLTFPVRTGVYLPIFEGVTFIDSNGYHIQLNADAESVNLQPATAYISLEKGQPGDKLKIECVPGGSIFIHNTGTAQCSFSVKTHKELPVNLAAGEWHQLSLKR